MDPALMAGTRDRAASAATLTWAAPDTRPSSTAPISLGDETPDPSCWRRGVTCGDGCRYAKCTQSVHWSTAKGVVLVDQAEPYGLMTVAKSRDCVHPMTAHEGYSLRMR